MRMRLGRKAIACGLLFTQMLRPISSASAFTKVETIFCEMEGSEDSGVGGYR